MQNEELILKYLPLANKLGRQYLSIDGEAEARFALVLAAQKFKPELGGSFPMFARYAIRDRLRRLAARKMPASVDWQAIESAEDGDAPWLQALRALAVESRAQEYAERHDFARSILKVLTRSEKRLLLLLLRQESQKCIGNRLGLSQPTVSRRVKALGCKAREIIGVYNGSRERDQGG